MVDQRVRLGFGLLLLLGLCSLIPGAASAQRYNKPYQQWTANEAKLVLLDSPWAETRAGLIRGALPSPPNPRTPDPLDDSSITVRLYSALPVRQALARLRQLRNQYDKKSASDKAAIDAENKPVLECSACPDQYVVTVSPGPRSRNDVPGAFRTMSLATLKLNVYIKNEKGETRELVNVIRPLAVDGDAMLFFPRFNSQGEPLISPKNHTLIIWFDPRLFGKFTGAFTKFEFDVAKMTINGKVVF